MDNALIQAGQNFKKGQEALKTGLFKWTKDYATASMYFEEAAKLYKQGRDMDNAIKSLNMCVETNEKMHDNWACARNVENIINILLEKNSEQVIPELLKQFDRAIYFFRLADSAINYVQVGTKVGRFLESCKRLDEAKEMYRRILELIEDDGIQHIKKDIQNSFVAVLVEQQRHVEAAKIFEREVAINKENAYKSPVCSYALTSITLFLIGGAPEMAEEAITTFLKEYGLLFLEFRLTSAVFHHSLSRKNSKSVRECSMRTLKEDRKTSTRR
eukprot:TRINITY_DN1026_c0_g1_i2.p1 TRINITY_DN1026_c0_g1~~TRINITY_DN1026_c0_g1_i2.p1  ORF type:complete len:272 (+),score=75.45 TRINITY_DN1026_c0_g1_i2:121-936(+)